MAAKKSTQKNSKGDAVGLGIGLTAAAVAAAGAYFLYGSKKAPQNRQKVKGWTLKAKGEILEALEKADKITEGEYDKLVETATKAYGTVKRATKGEIADFKSEMLQHWDDLQKNKAVKKIASKVTAGVGNKLAAKKAPRKAAPKKLAKKTASKKTTS